MQFIELYYDAPKPEPFIANKMRDLLTLCWRCGEPNAKPVAGRYECEDAVACAQLQEQQPAAEDLPY